MKAKKKTIVDVIKKTNMSGVENKNCRKGNLKTVASAQDLHRQE